MLQRSPDEIGAGESEHSKFRSLSRAARIGNLESDNVVENQIQLLVLVMERVERWPSKLNSLYATAVNNAPDRFVDVIQSLHQEYEDYHFVIDEHKELLTDVAIRLENKVHICQWDFSSATAAARQLSECFIEGIWETLACVCKCNTDGFKPEFIAEPANWSICRADARKFFDREKGTVGIVRALQNLEVAVHRERVALKRMYPVRGGVTRQKPAKTDSATKKLCRQRNGFSCPRRRKNPPETWSEIYEAYEKKYPSDVKASPDTLRHAHERNCPNCG